MSACELIFKYNKERDNRETYCQQHSVKSSRDDLFTLSIL